LFEGVDLSNHPGPRAIIEKTYSKQLLKEVNIILKPIGDFDVGFTPPVELNNRRCAIFDALNRTTYKESLSKDFKVSAGELSSDLRTATGASRAVFDTTNVSIKAKTFVEHATTSVLFVSSSTRYGPPPSYPNIRSRAFLKRGSFGPSTPPGASWESPESDSVMFC
jgi:hypothetical protein